MEVAVAETLLRVNKGTYDRDLDAADKRLTSFGSGSQSAFQRLGASFTSIGTAMTIGITAPLALLAKQILTVGVDYEKSMNVFQAVTRASGTEMARAGDLAKKLGADMSLPATSAGNAAKAMTELAKGGLTASEAMDAVKGTLQLAAAATIEEGQAATITANALNAFGLAASEAGRVSDLLAAAANASSAEITDVAASMQQSSASAAALKIPIEDLITSITLMANAGIKGSDAGTSMKTMFAALTPKTTEAANAMKQLGIDAFDAQGRFVGMEAIIAQAAPALAKLTDEQKAFTIEAAFGSDAQRAANIVLGAGVEKFNEMSVAVNRSGAAAELAAAKAKGLGGAWDGLKSQLETVALVIFEKVGPGLEKMVRWFADVVSGIDKINPQFLQMGIVAAAVFGASGPILVGLGAVTKAFTALGAAGGPIALAITAIAGLAAAYSTNFGEMRTTIDSFFKFFSDEIKKGNGITIDWGAETHKAALSIAQGFDIAQHAIRQLIAMTIALAQATTDLASGDFSGMVNHWKANLAAIEAADAAFMERRKARIDAVNAIDKATHKKHVAELLGIALEGATAMNAAFDKNLNLAAPVKKELEQMRGPLLLLSEQIGGGMGRSVMFGWDKQTRRSPFFIIHDLQEAMDFAATLPPKFQAIGTAAGKAIVSGWKPNLDTLLSALNDWSQAVGARLNFTKEMWEKLRNDVKAILSKKAKDHKDLQDTLEQIYIGIAAFPEKVSTAAKKALAVLTPINQEIIKQYDDVGKALSKTADVTGAAHALMIEAWLAHERAADEAADGIKNAAQKVQEESERAFRALSDEFQRLSRELPDSWNKIIDGILNSSGKLGSELLKLGVTVKGWAKDIIGVVGTLPGKFGDAARDILRTVDQWVQFANSVLAILNRLNKDIPATIEGAIEAIIGIFKSKKNDVQTAMEDILFGNKDAAGSAGAASGQSFTSKFLGALGGITAGVATFFGTRGQGRLAGILGGASAGASIGASIGSLFGPGPGTAIGMGIGAAAGAILGLFGAGGPSEAEKREQERQAAQAFAGRAQEIINAGLEGMRSALELFKDLSNYTGTAKKSIKRFINDLELLLKELFNALKKFATENFANMKAFGESMAPAIGMLGVALQLFNELRTYTKIPEQAIKDLISDFSILEGLLEEALADVELKVVKQMGKISNKLVNSFELLKLALEVIKGAAEYKPIESTIFDSIFADLYTLIDRFSTLADEFKTFALAKTKKSAEQMAAIVESIGASIGVLKSIGEYQKIGTEIFTNILDDLRAVLGWQDDMIALADEGIAKGLTFEERMAEWGATIARGLSALASIAGGSFNVTAGSALTAGTTFNSLATAPAGGGGGGFGSQGSSAPVSYHTHYHGTVIQDQQHRELLLRDMVALQRSGRLRSGTVEE